LTDIYNNSVTPPLLNRTTTITYYNISKNEV
jgi:hypothetical protein